MQRLILSPFFLLLLLLGLAGCQSHVAYDYDRGADLGQAQSFAFAPIDSETASAGERTSIEQAIRRELEQEGMTLVRDRSSDLLIHYRLEPERSLDRAGLSPYGVPVAGFNEGEGANAMQLSIPREEQDVRPAELVVEVMDSNRDELIWRASALMDFESNASASERALLLDDVVRRMFEHFPTR